VRQILTTLNQEVDGQATVLSFVGAPWTLAAYAIEGKSSKDYAIIKAWLSQNDAASISRQTCR